MSTSDVHFYAVHTRGASCLCSDRHSHSRGLRHRYSMGRARSVHLGTGCREAWIQPPRIRQKGALYSLLSFALWRSLMKVMHGSELHAGYVRTGYMTLFDCWFVTAPLLSVLFAMCGHIRSPLCKILLSSYLGSDTFLRVVHFNAVSMGVSPNSVSRLPFRYQSMKASGDNGEISIEASELQNDHFCLRNCPY